MTPAHHEGRLDRTLNRIRQSQRPTVHGHDVRGSHAVNHRHDVHHERAEPDDHGVFRKEVRAWYEANATPKNSDNPWAVAVFADAAAAARHFEQSRAWQATLFEAGLAGIAWPAAYGGGGKPSWMARIEREVSRDFEESVGFIGATTAMLGPALLRHATTEQKHEYLPKLLSAELTFCQLFSEPNAGSDLASLATRAVRDGDEFVINGQKVWNSCAQHCDWGFLLVRTNLDAAKHKGITFLLVDMSTPGIEIRPLVQMNRSAHFNEVFLREVRVGVSNVIGAINEGWSVARTVLANESAFIGGAKAPTFDNLLRLADLHGRTSDASIRQDLMRFLIRDRVSNWMGEQIQQAVRRGDPPPIDPGLIKLTAAMNRALSGDLAMTIGGAAGLVDDTKYAHWSQIELMGRFAVSIGGGTNEVIRNNVAERTLGLPREPGFDPTIAWRAIPR